MATTSDADFRIVEVRVERARRAIIALGAYGVEDGAGEPLPFAPKQPRHTVYGSQAMEPLDTTHVYEAEYSCLSRRDATGWDVVGHLPRKGWAARRK
eukprot:CAMPEP_0115882406 /NCGR_PEP_ID=MMETSP0287-20121206/28986_1 /TAXON_ID=412157 /ORGANISM="Chrysochromulina rotalis, Strain UIO044" /LENGTH=96 /DNA_ID=CAMNT_0003338479 /DNA_START=375 /DNA_END=665 /DNA_ORIENTATION=+